MARSTRLVRAMRRAAVDPAAEPDFRRALHAATVLVPQPGPSRGTGAQLPVTEHRGQRVVPVFTSRDALRDAVGADTAYVEVRVADLQRRWRDGVGMAVDLGGQLGTVLSDADVRALPGAPRVRAVHVGAREQFAVGEPRADVTGLRDALARHLAAGGDVDAAHLALVAFPDQPAQLVLGVVLRRGGSPSDVARDLPEVDTPHPLAVVAVDVEAPDALGAALLDHPDILAG